MGLGAPIRTAQQRRKCTDFDQLTLHINNKICVNYGYRTKNYNKISDLWQFCVPLCSRCHKSRVSEGHLCWVLFSKVSWFRSAIEHANTRFQDLDTFYYSICTECSCLHSLGRAYSASGSEANHMAFLWQGHICVCCFLYAGILVCVIQNFLVNMVNSWYHCTYRSMDI